MCGGIEKTFQAMSDVRSFGIEANSACFRDDQDVTMICCISALVPLSVWSLGAAGLLDQAWVYH